MAIADLENEIIVLKKSLLEKDKLIEELKFENERLRNQFNVAKFLTQFPNIINSR